MMLSLDRPHMEGVIDKEWKFQRYFDTVYW
jgi:hypothetical protein